MITGLDNEQITDDLNRWWWPGQWLHIVIGVWVDQLWYWQNVRPRLQGRTQGWGIFAQSLLGAMVMAVALILGMALILESAAVPINWKYLVLGTALCVVIVVVLSILGGLIRSITDSVAGIAGSGVLIAGSGLALSVDWNSVFSQVLSVPKDWGAITALLVVYAVMGVNWGVIRSVADGSISIFECLLEAVFLGLAVKERNSIAASMAAGATWSLGVYVGMRWATRQVPDTETRKRFANPKDRQANQTMKT